MRYLDRSKFAQGPHRATVRRAPVWLSLFAGVSVLAMMTAGPAHAQFAVDVSDPSISVDLSVLNDGGLSSPSNLPMYSSSPSRGGAYQMPGQMPGADLPVSTLYVQPTESFTLPQQTKSLIAKPAPEVEPATSVVEDMSAPADSDAEIESATDTVPETPALEEPIAEAPMAEEPVTDEVASAPEIAMPAAPEAPTQEAPPQTAKAEPEPAPEPEPEPEVAAPAPTKDVAETEPTPAPEPAPAEPEVAADTAAQVPPPPQALTQTPPTAPSATPPAQPDVTAAAPGAVVVDLPPKLEEQQQPGVASLPSATGPLSDGDNMRIVFEQDSSKLSSDVRDALKTLSDRLGQQESLRLQLLAYAGDDNTSASAARRLSLSRALAVRSYLIENGVRSTRIDVRALGNKSTEAVTERVDITIVER
ncbi:MAG: OmpA family protein [Rhodospirillales bacterium]|nr:OmpA family protein [Rhodospirillales bacterium]